MQQPCRKRVGAKKHCCYGICTSDSRYNKDGLFYFISFPKPCKPFREGLITTVGTKKHFKECSSCHKADSWVRLCNQQISPRKNSLRNISDITKDTYICSLHFVGESGPSAENPNPLRAVKRKASCKVRTDLDTKYRRCGTTDTMHKSLMNENLPQVSSMIDDIETETDVDFNDSQENVSCVEIMCNLNLDTTVEKTSSSKKKTFSDASTQSETHLIVRSTQTQTENAHCSSILIQTDGVQSESRASQTTLTIFPYMAQLNKYKIRCKEMGKKVANMPKRCIEKFEKSVSNNKKKCLFYTGLEFQQILIMLTLLGPCVNNLKYWNSESSNVKKSNKKRKFSPIQELLIVLMRLRRGFLVADLAYRFNLSAANVTNLTITWVQFMYLQFTDLLKPHMFPSRSQIFQNLPKLFKRLKNIRVLIDCTEFFCEAPGNFEHQGNLYSNYKSHTTFKVLIGCTPNGAISFVSDLFEGSISDREIFKQSNLIDLLEDGDLVLADRGFTVNDIVEAKGASLNIPPFLKGRKNLTVDEEIETKKIAKERIYVEHVVGRLKRYRILKRIIPLNMRGMLNQIVFVCACLVNFQPPILLD